jgi:hypothetical protein
VQENKLKVKGHDSSGRGPEFKSPILQKRAGDIAHWWRTSLAHERPRIQFPTPQREKCHLFFLSSSTFYSNKVSKAD